MWQEPWRKSNREIKHNLRSCARIQTWDDIGGMLSNTPRQCEPCPCSYFVVFLQENNNKKKIILSVFKVLLSIFSECFFCLWATFIEVLNSDFNTAHVAKNSPPKKNNQKKTILHAGVFKVGPFCLSSVFGPFVGVRAGSYTWDWCLHHHSDLWLDL